MRTEYISSSPQETRRIAIDFGSSLKGGELILAKGELGAGKTFFLKGIGEALKVKEIINSPTFNLMRLHKGEKIDICHVDFYRLEGIDDSLKDIGLDDYLDDSSYIVYCEWPEYARSGCFKKRKMIVVEFEVLSEFERRIVIDDQR